MLYRAHSLEKELTIKPLWFAPLNDPMRLLIYSMAFGLVHLFVGLGIKGYMLLKDGKVLDFFCDIVLWYIFPDWTDPDAASVRDICFDRTDEDRVPCGTGYIVESNGDHRSTRTVTDVRKIKQESGTQTCTWSI